MGDPWINAIIGMWLYKKGELIMAMKDDFLESLMQERLLIQDKRKELQCELIALDATIEHYCKRHNICLECRGTGEVYCPSNDGDPHHRSSDDRKDCSVCGGNGKYKGGK